MIAFGNLKQSALLALTFFWLTACTSSGPALNPPPQPETTRNTTVSPSPARADEPRTRDALVKHKLEESSRITHEMKSATAPTTAMDGGSAEREAVPTGTNAGAVFPPLTRHTLHPWR
mgnify:CR=1 FL=1